ncbi:MAG TPA: DUF4129 domain-containing protein [Candidatus Dormibacteraeota bacterium]|nr:DUF4129 domain-containing protein [Candidatus Dormibacteraeota bacterium]
MRSSWAANRLLPTLQVVAEGSWLAVVYAALQALAGAPAWLGPIELGVMAWAGMAWGRRRRWTSPAAEALGLPLLALAAGAIGWLLAPEVRSLLADGELLAALGQHGPGWLAAIAFWRGEMHRSAEDDDALQDQLLRWGIPGLAIPWALGHGLSSGQVEADFTAAAFVGTVFFAGSAFMAMGLARLEAVRASTGSDWRSNRSWLVLVVGVAIGLTVVAIPAGAFLGVPARSLLVALLGPLQTILLLLLLLATPIILIAAGVAELIQPLLPEGFGLGDIQLPDFFTADPRQATSGVPTVVFYLIVGSLLVLELAVLALVLWVRWQERRKMRAALADPFEERSIVIPAAQPTTSPVPPPSRGKRRLRSDDPTGAYLAALDSLARDGRWARRPTETPAAHVTRARGEGMVDASLGRLASAYQLVRYGGLRLGGRETRRATPRLAALRRRLRRSD